MTCYKEAIMRDSRVKNEIVERIRVAEKAERTKRIIKNAFDIFNLPMCANASVPVIAFSGGKDSLVVLDLVRQICPSVTAVFCNTGVEYDETIKFVDTVENVTELHPRISFFEIVEEEREKSGGKLSGLPQRKGSSSGHRGNRCCFELKERPAEIYYKENNVNLVFTGVTADESRNRMMFFKRMGHTYNYKKKGYVKCHPIHDWTPSDVWTYIRMNKLEYNKVYDIDKIQRCGCWPCTAYLSWKEVVPAYSAKQMRVLLNLEGQHTLDQFVTTEV